MSPEPREPGLEPLPVAGDLAQASEDVTIAREDPDPGFGDPAAGDRRRRTARGVVINSAFQVGLGGLSLLRAFIVAGFMTAADFGVWSILALAVAFVYAFKAAAVSEKYIQQSEPDQEVAFQKAFTLEVLSSAAMTVIALAAIPALALLYGEGDLVAPGIVLALIIPGLALRAPVWVFYRRLDFLRQRLLMSIEPVVSFAVTVALAVAGMDYWSLVIGSVAGTWVGGVVAVVASPYPLRMRYDRETLRTYVSFSWPLVVATGGALGMAQLSVFFGDLALGLAGAGAIGLAATYSAYTDRVDQIITQTLYPAVCRVADDRKLLAEAFTKSNRLGLMWGFPFGIALTLFAADLIEFGIGQTWSEALVLLQVFGAAAAVNHIGFNWSAFYRARADTKPIAIVTGLGIAAFAAVAIPLLFVAGLGGFAIGIACSTAVSVIVRWRYVLKLFPGFGVTRHMARAVAPTVPATLAVLAIRFAASGDRTLGLALGELAAYMVVTAVATFAFERTLIREALGYLRARSDGPRLRPA